MHVVIFRARVRDLDVEYSQFAQHLRDLAMSEFGCLEFYSLSEGLEEIAVSYWPDEAHIRAWKAHAEHLQAQKFGRERWYESYAVEVAEISRKYQFPRLSER
jgi:heme-degrading monooxygenase HmoA